MSVSTVLNIAFFLGFGLTLFGVPFAMLIAQVAALILGIILLVQAIKSL